MSAPDYCMTCDERSPAVCGVCHDRVERSLEVANETIKNLRATRKDTRQQVEAMLRIALTDRTDEWTIKSVDERVSILLSMFTKEKP